MKLLVRLLSATRVHHIFLYIYIYIYVCLYVFICMYICIYVYMYIDIGTETCGDEKERLFNVEERFEAVVQVTVTNIIRMG